VIQKFTLIRNENMKQTLAHQNVGLWIDHKEAFVVFSHEHKPESESITSDTGKHVRFSEHLSETGGLAEDQRDLQFQVHLNRYYDEVITHISDATAILILGPGEAKGEFKKRLEHKGFGSRIVGVETVDKLTSNQIAAKVNDYFHK
jgi:hypothetical protein